MTAEMLLTWLLVLPLASSPIVYLAGRLAMRRRPTGANPAGWLTLAVMVGCSAILFALGRTLTAGGVQITTGTIRLNFDGLSLLVSAVVTGLATLTTLFSLRYQAGEDSEEKFYALLLALTGAITGLGCAADLFNLWLWFECMAVSSYMLVAFYHNEGEALEAGVKYLVQSAAGSVLVLLGGALVFAQTGTLDLSAMRAATAGAQPALLAAGALFVVGFGVKAALVPLHTWLPDAHSQAPSGISAMLSGIVIEAGLVALLRSLSPLAQPQVWGMLLLVFGALNMLVGNLMALRQTVVKRLLAFSSLSHIGYMLVGLGAAFSFSSLDGAAGGFFHLITHGMMKGLAFFAAGALLYALHLSRGSHQPLTLDDLCGAARCYPLPAFALSVAVLGLGGLPPLAGFMSKWQVFAAGFQTGSTGMILLVVFAALNSVLSLGYYAPIVNRLYRKEPSEAVTAGGRVPVTMSIPLGLLVLAVIFLGVFPGLAQGVTFPAASALMAGLGR